MRGELQGYLNKTYPGHTRGAMTGDASTRRFWRLTLAGGGTRVVMDYGDAFRGETDDVRQTRLFQEAGLRVAEIEAVVPDAGCLVLEDLGERTLASALEEAGPRERDRLYREAVGLLWVLAGRGTRTLERSRGTDGPALDEARFCLEMEFFAEHYATGLCGRRPSDRLIERLHALAAMAAETPRRVLCHRDFHSRNLLVLDDGALAMVDIQDARWGPDAYDLASLLRDAYVDLEPSEVRRGVRTFRDGAPDGMIEPGLDDRFHVVGAQRMIKALGTFGYQITVVGNERYRPAIARTTARLRQQLGARASTASLGHELDEAGLLTSV